MHGSTTETPIKKRAPLRVTAALFVSVLLAFALVPASAFASTITSSWSSWRGDASNSGLTSALTARTSAAASLLWQTDVSSLVSGDADYEETAWASPSQPIIVDDQICIVEGNKVVILDDEGNIAVMTTLDNPIGYMCRPVYSDGLIIIPTSEGVIEAVNAETLEKVWTTDAIASQQLTCTLTTSGGYLYTGTADASWSIPAGGGYFECIDISTGEIVWQNTSSAGYYWAGAVVMNGAAIYAGDDGVLTSVNSKTGVEIDTLALDGSAVRSTVVAYSGSVYLTTYEGNLYKVSINSSGTFGVVKCVNYCDTSTGGPAVYDGKVYATGATTDGATYEGTLAVIDCDTMTVEKTVSAPASVQSAPLIATGYNDAVFIYYTSNTTPGALYVYELGDTSTEATTLFTPSVAQQNYCEFSPIAGSDGTIYYVNDSGYLFAVGNTDKTDAAAESGEDGSSTSVPTVVSSTSSGKASVTAAGDSTESSESSDEATPSDTATETAAAVDTSSGASAVSDPDAASENENESSSSASTNQGSSTSPILLVSLLATAVVVAFAIIAIRRRRSLMVNYEEN